MSYDDKPWFKSYDEGVNPDVEIPDISLVDRFARALIENGCRPGDIVGINLPNIPQYLIAQIGVLKAGCAPSGLVPFLTLQGPQDYRVYGEIAPDTGGEGG